MITPKLVRADKIEQRPLRWLWEGRIPLGQVTILEGDPGTGKSQLTCALAAIVSTGHDWPDGQPCQQGIAVMANAEDLAGEIIAPRVQAAGADMKQVFFVSPEQTDDNYFQIPDHVAGLEAIIKGHNIKLITFDPLESFCGVGVDLYRNQHARRAVMNVLGLLAQRADCAIIIVRHLTKDASRAALYRGGGSIGIIGAARSGLTVGRDPTNKDRCIVAPTKANWSKPAAPLAYKLEEVSYLYEEHVIKTSRIVWDGEAHVSADDLVTLDVEDKDGRATEAIGDFIRASLRDGPKPSKTVLADGMATGFTRKAMFAAVKFLNVAIYKDGPTGDGDWIWELKADTPAADAEPWANENFDALFQTG